MVPERRIDTQDALLLQGTIRREEPLADTGYIATTLRRSWMVTEPGAKGQVLCEPSCRRALVSFFSL